MKDPTILAAWLTAELALVRRGQHATEAEEAERRRLWDAVQAEGFTPVECLRALEQAMREEENHE